MSADRVYASTRGGKKNGSPQFGSMGGRNSWLFDKASVALSTPQW